MTNQQDWDRSRHGDLEYLGLCKVGLESYDVLCLQLLLMTTHVQGSKGKWKDCERYCRQTFFNSSSS